VLADIVIPPEGYVRELLPIVIVPVIVLSLPLTLVPLEPGVNVIFDSVKAAICFPFKTWAERIPYTEGTSPRVKGSRIYGPASHTFTLESRQ